MKAIIDIKSLKEEVKHISLRVASTILEKISVPLAKDINNDLNLKEANETFEELAHFSENVSKVLASVGSIVLNSDLEARGREITERIAKRVCSEGNLSKEGKK